MLLGLTGGCRVDNPAFDERAESNGFLDDESSDEFLSSGSGGTETRSDSESSETGDEWTSDVPPTDTFTIGNGTGSGDTTDEGDSTTTQDASESEDTSIDVSTSTDTKVGGTTEGSTDSSADGSTEGSTEGLRFWSVLDSEATITMPKQGSGLTANVAATFVQQDGAAGVAINNAAEHVTIHRADAEPSNFQLVEGRVELRFFPLFTDYSFNEVHVFAFGATGWDGIRCRIVGGTTQELRCVIVAKGNYFETRAGMSAFDFRWNSWNQMTISWTLFPDDDDPNLEMLINEKRPGSYRQWVSGPLYMNEHVGSGNAIFYLGAWESDDDTPAQMIFDEIRIFDTSLLPDD